MAPQQRVFRHSYTRTRMLNTYIRLWTPGLIRQSSHTHTHTQVRIHANESIMSSSARIFNFVCQVIQNPGYLGAVVHYYILNKNNYKYIISNNTMISILYGICTL